MLTPRRLHCVHFAESICLSEGGVTRAILDLTTALIGKPIDLTIASPNIDIDQVTRSSLGLSVAMVTLPNDGSFMRTVDELICNASVLHLHAPWWQRNPSIIDSARRHQKQAILSTHGMLDDWSMEQKRLKKQIYMSLIGRQMLDQCVIHCTAEEEKRQCSSRLSPKGFEVIPLVIDRKLLEAECDPSLAQKEWGFLKSDEPNLLFLSRVHPKKSLDIALHALAELKSGRLIVAGSGDADYIKELKLLSRALGIADRVHWLGLVVGEKKNSLLAACDIFVLPTLQENFGFAQIEALGFGLNVITTRGTDNWRELSDCGAIVAERSGSGFAKAIESVLPTLKDRPSRLIRQRAALKSWIDPTTISDQYLELYRRYGDYGPTNRVHRTNSLIVDESKAVPDVSSTSHIKVLHIVAGLSVQSGGPSVSITSLCDSLVDSRKDWDFRILTSEGKRNLPMVLPDRSEIQQLSGSARTWNTYRRMLDQIAAYGPSIIHDHGQWLATNRAAAEAARQLCVPRVVSPRGMLTAWARRYRMFRKQIAWWFYARADLANASLLHATSQLEMLELRSIGCKQPIAVIPNGIRKIPVTLADKKAVPPYALFLSRIHRKKGIEELITAWRKCDTRGWRLVIAGPDPDGMMSKLHSVEDRCIEYVGPVFGEEKWRWLQQASLFVLPSHSENFGIVIAEALACGTPVLTTTGTPWRDLTDRKCGWCIPLEPNALTQTLQAALSTPLVELNAMGERGRLFVEREFSWNEIASSMLEVYDWLLFGGETPACIEVAS